MQEPMPTQASVGEKTSEGMSDDKTLASQENKRGRRNTETDIRIGAQLKVARVTAGKSMSDVAHVVGITHQQVQKYESGRDRIAASTLQVIAEFLGVQPGFFFADVPAPNGSIADFMAALEKADDFQHVKDPRIRKRLSTLLRTLADKIDP